MPGPHQDNGVPWSPKPPTTNTPVNTTNVNFGYNNSGTGQTNNNQNVNQVSPGHPGGGYNPNQNQINKNIIQTTPDPNDEKGDYMDWNYVNPDTGKTAAQMAAEAKMQGEKERLEKERQARLKAGTDISSAIGGTGTTQQELEYMLKRGTMSTKMAVHLGYAKPVMAMTPDGILKPTGSYIDTKTGKPYVPKDYGFSSDILTTAGGKTVDDWKKGVLGDIQLMQDEGVYGGVSGNEAVTNEMKGSSVEAIKKLQAQGLSPDEIKSAMQSHPDFKGLINMFGGNVDTALLNTVGLSGMMGDGFWDEGRLAQFQEASELTEVGTKGDVGYDPTGTKTFSDLTEDEYKHKFLKRGELWDDPLSGIFNPELTSSQEGGGFNFRPRMSQRERNSRLLQFLNAGLPIKQLEQSGFYNEGVRSPYAPGQAEALQEGIFKKAIPGGAFTPEAMKRLLKTFASGYSSPRYENRARGGIMSAWNDMRR